MKNNSFLRWLPGLAVILGLTALGLHRALYAVALDGKNLLTLWHPLAIALWAVTAVTVILVPLTLRKTENLRGYHRNHPGGLPGALGCFLMAACLGVTILQGERMMAELVLGLGAIVGLVIVGLGRLRKKRPSYVYHALVCLYFALHLIGRYRFWRGNPQAEDYAFAMFACVALMLFAYQQTAFDGGYCSRRSQLTWGILSTYFCLAALSGGEEIPFYAGGALWSLTNLCSTAPVPGRGEQEVC